MFYFTINLVEHCCLRPEVPLLVIRIAWNFIKQAIESNRLKLTENHKQFAITKIEKIRAEIVFEFVHNLGINSTINPDYFEKLVANHLENARFADATTLIVKFNLFHKFDLMELVLNLV